MKLSVLFVALVSAEKPEKTPTEQLKRSSRVILILSGQNGTAPVKKAEITD